MAQVRGEIAFEALAVPPASLPIEARGDARWLALPGVALSWDARRVDVACEHEVLAIATGRAHDDDAKKDATEAARWIARYRARGHAAADGVGGGFAAIIVDFARQRATMWVDRFAMESLCYRTEGASLAFSDHAREVPDCAGDLDPQALFDYLYFHVIPAPRTVYRDVARLDAGHRLVAAHGSRDIARYWSPAFVEDDRTRRGERMAEFVECVRRAVEQEAEGATTACFLSGGTDSSTIAGMLARIRGTPAHAYSIGFDADGYDEMEYARIAAKHFGLAHDAYYLTPDDLVEAIPRVAASLDQPFGNSSLLPAYFCASRAHADGFARMLAGDGGDELYGGNTRYARQKVFDVYHRLPASIRHRLLEPPACDWKMFRSVPGLRQAGGYVRHARAPMPDRMNAFNLLDYVGLDRIFESDFIAEVDAGEPRERQRGVWRASQAQSLTNRMLEYDWKFTLADSDLPKVRAATQLAGVSVGYPFLSRELADLSLTLPAEWKVRGLTLRWFFKQALKDFLPEPILRKKKHGFGLPFGAWLLKNGRLRALADDALGGVAARGVVRRELLSELMTMSVPKAPGFYGELVWVLMMLELWMRGCEGTLSRPPSSDGAIQNDLAAATTHA
jgi:asparagine synthase (glutamine-hydrolysing)